MTMPTFEPVATVVDDFDGWTKVRKHIPMATGTQLFTADQLQQAIDAAFEAGKQAATNSLLITEQISSKAAQVEQEPVYYEYRSLWGDNTVSPGWSEWERVKPRDSLCTIEDAVSELEQYIAAGYKYQLRSLYAAPAVPEGWKLVPIEPTEEMERRGAEATHGIEWSDAPEDAPYELAVGIYNAMLAAPPEPTK